MYGAGLAGALGSNVATLPCVSTTVHWRAVAHAKPVTLPLLSVSTGVGLPGAADHTSGAPVTTFTRDAATYRLNTGRDRDKDKIACEKR